MTESIRKNIEDINARFAAAFNRDDLDGVMEFFTNDAIYVEFNGSRNQGKEEIRKAFEPQFRGDYGAVRFHSEDFFFDEEENKAVAMWRCSVEVEGKAQEWKGLDIFYFDGELIKEKHTYAHAAMPLLNDI